MEHISKACSLNDRIFRFSFMLGKGLIFRHMLGTPTSVGKKRRCTSCVVEYPDFNNHSLFLFQDKEEAAKDETGEEVKENGLSETEEAAKTPETEKNAAAGDQAETAEAQEEVKAEEGKDEKKNKEKGKKKKWSFRSISFSKKDKSKPGKEAEKNGEIKETPAEVSETDSPSSFVSPLKCNK